MHHIHSNNFHVTKITGSNLYINFEISDETLIDKYRFITMIFGIYLMHFPAHILRRLDGEESV